MNFPYNGGYENITLSHSGVPPLVVFNCVN